MENKKLILEMLQITLGETAAYDSIQLELDDFEETVVVTYKGGLKQLINVACDSASAMIRDVVKHLYV